MRSLRVARISLMQGRQAVRALYAAEALSGRSYAEQLARLLEKKIYYSDIFGRAMSASGHEALEIFYDVDPLHQAWAREHGVDWGREGRMGTVVAQLKQWKPDVVYFQDIFGVPSELRTKIKAWVPTVRAVVVYKGSPGSIREIAGSDLVFAATPYLLRAFRQVGVETRLLYHSFDDSVWREFESSEGASEIRPHPVTFAGTSGYGWGRDFQARYWTLRRLFEKIETFEAWVDELVTPDWKGRIWSGMKSVAERLPNAALQAIPRAALCPAPLKKAAAQTLFWRQALQANRAQFPAELFFGDPRIPDRPLQALFPDRCHGPKFGWELFRLLGRSRVVVNRHADVVAGFAGNIRLFETTGMGACLVTERCQNLSDLFVEGEEVVTYDRTEECVEKVRYLLDHPAEAERIARAGQARTLRDHTALARARTVSEELQKLVARA